MRPLFFDFSSDPLAATVEDQFMFGPNYMVAPVLEPGATERAVVFPGTAAVTFRHHFSGQAYAGGTAAQVPVASLDTFPLFALERAASDAVYPR